MLDAVVLVSIPGLREPDLDHLPRLTSLTRNGDRAPLAPSFPCVACPVQTNMLTGQLPREHGVVANGFYLRDELQVEMWPAGSQQVFAPQIWDILRRYDNGLTSAAWFPLLGKACSADWMCMSAPPHELDGSAANACASQPTQLYGELQEMLGGCPPRQYGTADLTATQWIVDSAVQIASRFQPRFFYIHLPQLDHLTQKAGPGNEVVIRSLPQLDSALSSLAAGLTEAYADHHVLWLIASAWVNSAVDQVTYPNRLLREAGLLRTRTSDSGETLDFVNSQAWALVDHQFSHVFLRDANRAMCGRVASMFRRQDGIAAVLGTDQLREYALDHLRSGDLVLISTPNSWQAYYWWMDDAQAPESARTIGDPRKPGYDPLELYVDETTGELPLDASLVKGSSGAPARSAAQRGLLMSSERGVFVERAIPDTEIADIVLRQFGI